MSISCRRSFLLQATAPYSSNVQSVVQPPFWKNMIPKPLRRTEADIVRKSTTKPKTKEWNPATFYIWIFLLIGSMSIQMIALKNQHATFSRRADAKIELLREVIEKIHNGEEVDVKGLLGTGDKQQEKEWEEVLKEIENDRGFHEKPVKQQGPAPTQEATASQQKAAFSTPPIREMESRKERSNAPRGYY